AVLDQVHHDRLAAEVAAQRHELARLVAKRQVERHLRVQLLIEADSLQDLSLAVRRPWRSFLAVPAADCRILSVSAGRREQRGRREGDTADVEGGLHRNWFSRTVPPLATEGRSSSRAAT